MCFSGIQIILNSVSHIVSAVSLIFFFSLFCPLGHLSPGTPVLHPDVVNVHHAVASCVVLLSCLRDVCTDNT